MRNERQHTPLLSPGGLVTAYPLLRRGAVAFVPWVEACCSKGEDATA